MGKDSDIVYTCNNVDIRKIKMKDLECVKQLGQGSYGIVMLYKNTITKKQFAVKFLGIKKSITNKNLKNIQHEIYVLNKMKISDKECHPNLLCIDSYGRIDNYIYIISEYIDGITLTDYIEYLKNKKKLLHIDKFLYITEQLFNGLKFLHSKQIGHSDIKPDNIMINPKTLQVKIIDPGLACSKLLPCGASGSPMYMAPEMLDSFNDIEVYPTNVKKADIFSLGYTLYILFNRGKYPLVSIFNTKCTIQYYNAESIKLDSGYPELNYIIDNMLQSNYTKRWGVIKCVKELAKLKNIKFK
ncbi:hypothetical protein CCP3SC1AL1_690007 [Gammaproteobacteria bacterium]